MYKVTVGLEIHTELKTISKIFSSAKNTYSLDANTCVEPLDIALPGTMPVLNKEVLLMGIKLAKIFNMDIAENLIFDRKHYFYTDLPKGYQITQFTRPIGINGTYKMYGGKTIRLHDIHIEEDTASLDHYDNYTLVDYNRSGIPLIEIVTEPDFEYLQAVTFLEDLRLILRNNELSDADITKGQIRCDVNISVSDTDTLGTRVEVKNVNGIANVKKVIEVESKRQIDLLNNNEEVKQETRRFDEKNNTTVLMRTKEDAIDYRYFVEPNIPIFKIPSELVDSVILTEKLPNELLNYYTNDLGVTLVNAKKIIKSKNFIKYFEECINLNLDSVKVSNLLTGVITEYLNEKNIDIDSYSLTPSELKILLDKESEGTLSSKQVKEVILGINDSKLNVSDYIEKNNIKQINDSEEIKDIISNILNKEPDKVSEYNNGNANIFKYFIGVIMKETKGCINPQKANTILEELLKGGE